MIATSARTTPVAIIHWIGPPPEVGFAATIDSGSPVSARTVAVGIGITEVAVGVGVTVTVTIVVGVLVGVAVTIVGVAVGVEVFGVLVGVGVFVGLVGVLVGVAVLVGVLVGVAVFVGVAVGVLGVLVAVGVAVLVGVLVGVAVFVGVAVGVGVSVIHADPDTGVPLQGSGTSVGVLGTFVPIGVGSGRSALAPLVGPSIIEPSIMASATTLIRARDILRILVPARGTPPHGALVRDKTRKAADLKNLLRP